MIEKHEDLYQDYIELQEEKDVVELKQFAVQEQNTINSADLVRLQSEIRSTLSQNDDLERKIQSLNREIMTKDYKIKELNNFQFEDFDFIGIEAQKQQKQFKETVLVQVEKVIAAKSKEL